MSAPLRPGLAVHRTAPPTRALGGTGTSGGGSAPGGDEWFEIFFDLVFAVAIGLWAERVAADPRVAVYVRSIPYLLPVWWVWLGQTVYAARFRTDEPAARILALVQIVAVGVMTTELQFDHLPSARYPLGFVAARVAMLALYVRAARTSPDARAVVSVYLVGFGAGAAIWASSLLLPPPWRGPAWLLGLTVDFAVPWIGRPTLQRLPLDRRRVPSRVGVFTSLLLFVAIDGIVRGLVEKGWTGWTVPVALLSFAVAVAAWWIYAARVNRHLRWALGSGQPYLYAHFLVVLGVGTMSVGIRLAIAAASPGGAAARALAFVAAGLFLWILGLVAIREIVVRHADPFWHAPFLAAAFGIPVITALGAGLHPVATLAVFLAVLLALLAIELRHGDPHGGPGHGHGAPAAGAETGAGSRTGPPLHDASA